MLYFINYNRKFKIQLRTKSVKYNIIDYDSSGYIQI